MSTHTNPLADMIRQACREAIQEAMNVTEIQPRRLMTIKEAAIYLALGDREQHDR